MLRIMRTYLFLQSYSALKIHQVRDAKLERRLSFMIDHLCHYHNFRKDAMGQYPHFLQKNSSGALSQCSPVHNREQSACKAPDGLKETKESRDLEVNSSPFKLLGGPTRSHVKGHVSLTTYFMPRLLSTRSFHMPLAFTNTLK